MTPNYTTRPIAQIQGSQYNPRTLTRARFEDLKRSLKEDPDFLRVRPIIVNTHPGREGVIIGGHMRFEAAKALGWTEIPCVEVDVPPEKERAWNVKDNAHHGVFDEEKLAELIMSAPEEFETALPGDELDSILNEYGPDNAKASEEEQVEKIADAETHITQTGDAWQLGEHILVCGDSTDPATYTKLLGDLKCPHCGADNT